LAVVVLPTRDRPVEDESGLPAPASKESPWRQLDWTGTWSLAVAVTAGLLALNEAPSWGFAAPATLGVFGLSLVTGVFFVVHERGDPHPLIPLRYFRMRNFVFPLGARTFVNFSYMGGFFLFTILTERIYGYSETRAGLVSTARPLMFSIVAPIAGYAAVKVGERVSVVAGAVALTISMVVFTQLGVEPSLLVIVVALALSGVGNGLSTPATAASASNEVAPDELGVMSAAQQLITQIGIVAGIQVMVTVEASSHGGVGSLASFHRAYAVGAVGAVLAGVCGFFMRDTPRPGRGRAAPDVHLG
jgi:predicted MFS family arabinose efflux permease